MKALIIDDNVFKQSDIEKVLRSTIKWDIIDCERNLEYGLDCIEESIECGQPYDLIVTDMWYPERKGGDEFASGEKLIQIAVERKWDIPIILCSSINYHFSEILGAVHYSENDNWEEKMRQLVEKCCDFEAK